jgi:pSer/pThr/pTyr-binding forkhead associated (FHA) protein
MLISEKLCCSSFATNMNPFARLISLNQAPGNARQVLTLKLKEAILGREKGCKIRIPSSAISRQHCRLGVKNDMVVVEDLGSSNGTFVNEQPISGMCYLKPGDVLRVGPFRFLVHYQLSDEAVNHLLEILTISSSSVDESVDVELLDDV